MLRSTLISLLVCSCAGTPVAAPTPSDTSTASAASAPAQPAPPPPAPDEEVPAKKSTLPKGWWVVERNTTVEKMNQAAFRFDDAGYVVITEDKSDARTCKWTDTGASWHCAGALPFTLTEVGDRLKMTLARGEIELAPAAADRVAKLDARAGALAGPDATCDRAEKCCLAAFKLFKSECNVEEELQGKTSVRTCMRFLSGMRKLLDQANKSVPESCAEP